MFTMKAIIAVLNQVPRRGGLQNEGTHAVEVKIQALKCINCSVNADTIAQLSLVHDIKEIELEGEFVKQILLNSSPEVRQGIDILTRQEGETSKEHFERVLDCNNKEVLIVKMADCLVNAKFTEKEMQWHWNTFKTSPKKQRIKYLSRVGMILEKLNTI